MKKFLAILVLGLFLITPSQADDIRDFQIEGMSIGDSLLDYFTEKQILDKRKNWFNDNEYTITVFEDKTFKSYDKLQIVYKTNDIEKKIAAIDGLVDYVDINLCYKKLDDEAQKIKSVVKNLKDLGKETYKHNADKSGKSLTTDYSFVSENFDEVQVACYDYSESFGAQDHFRVGIRTISYRKFLRNKAYK